jgi:hypothetical protein
MRQNYVLLMIVLPIFGSNQLHRPIKDQLFWNPARILAQEPVVTAWPDDAINSAYVGKWSYYYRRAGMQTSTDDHIVSLLAIYPNLDVKGRTITLGQKQQQPTRYVDLGCGIGSSLLTVAHELKPIESLGIEAQAQSYTLLQRTLDELPQHERPPIACIRKDLRELALADILPGTCDLVTANPPYARLEEGTLPKDPQRRSARFELRGGVEEYMLRASNLLKNDVGRFVMSFWNRDDARVEAAAAAAGLCVHRKIEIIMGATGSNVYEMRHHGSEQLRQPPDVQQLDITRDPTSGGGLHQNYLLIRAALNLAPRPLKESSRSQLGTKIEL